MPANTPTAWLFSAFSSMWVFEENISLKLQLVTFHLWFPTEIRCAIPEHSRGFLFQVVHVLCWTAFELQETHDDNPAISRLINILDKVAYMHDYVPLEMGFDARPLVPGQTYASVASGQMSIWATSIWAIPCGQMSMWANSIWSNVHLDKFHVGQRSWAKHIFFVLWYVEWRETSWVWSWHTVLELTDILQTITCCQLFVLKWFIPEPEWPGSSGAGTCNLLPRHAPSDQTTGCVCQQCWRRSYRQMMLLVGWICSGYVIGYYWTGCTVLHCTE